MLKFLLVFLGLTLFTEVCGQGRSPVHPVTDTTRRLITLETTACRGTCPVQVLSVFADGWAVYEGRFHTDWEGTYERRLSQKELRTLVKQFRAVRFFTFKNSYTEKVTDLPSTYLTFCDEGHCKTILDYAGTPPEVRQLEQSVLVLLKKRGWKFVKPFHVLWTD